MLTFCDEQRFAVRSNDTLNSTVSSWMKQMRKEGGE